MSNNLTYKDYNDRSFAIWGDKEKYQEPLKKIGAKWNPRQKPSAGWLISKDKENDLKKLIAKSESTEPVKLANTKKTPPPKSRKEQTKYRRENSARDSDSSSDDDEDDDDEDDDEDDEDDNKDKNDITDEVVPIEIKDIVSTKEPDFEKEKKEYKERTGKLVEKNNSEHSGSHKDSEQDKNKDGRNDDKNRRGKDKETDKRNKGNERDRRNKSSEKDKGNERNKNAGKDRNRDKSDSDSDSDRDNDVLNYYKSFSKRPGDFNELHENDSTRYSSSSDDYSSSEDDFPVPKNPKKKTYKKEDDDYKTMFNKVNELQKRLSHVEIKQRKK